MKRKKYSVYFSEKEYKSISEYALSHGRDFSSFVRFFSLAEIKKHTREKAIYKRLEALEKLVQEKGA